MKQNVLRVSLLAGALYGWSCIQATAADPGPYLNVDVGVNIVNDFDSTITGPLDLFPGDDTATGKTDVDLGVRLGVAGGYRFTPMIGAELETGFLFNEVEGGGDVAISHIPFLANVVFRFDNQSPFIPFVGAGAGGVASFLDLDDDDLDTDEGDSDVVFAWQVLAGLHYRINDNMSAGVTYKYLGVDSPEFDIGAFGFEFETIHNHAILGSFNWSF